MATNEDALIQIISGYHLQFTTYWVSLSELYDIWRIAEIEGTSYRPKGWADKVCNDLREGKQFIGHFGIYQKIEMKRIYQIKHTRYEIQKETGIAMKNT